MNWCVEWKCGAYAMGVNLMNTIYWSSCQLKQFLPFGCDAEQRYRFHRQATTGACVCVSGMDEWHAETERADNVSKSIYCDCDLDWWTRIPSSRYCLNAICVDDNRHIYMLGKGYRTHRFEIVCRCQNGPANGTEDISFTPLWLTSKTLTKWYKQSR